MPAAARHLFGSAGELYLLFIAVVAVASCPSKISAREWRSSSKSAMGLWRCPPLQSTPWQGPCSAVRRRGYLRVPVFLAAFVCVRSLLPPQLEAWLLPVDTVAEPSVRPREDSRNRGPLRSPSHFQIQRLPSSWPKGLLVQYDLPGVELRRQPPRVLFSKWVNILSSTVSSHQPSLCGGRRCLPPVRRV